MTISIQPQKLIHPWRLTWNIKMEVWKIMFLSFHGWCVGSMLIFQGVWFTWTAQRGGSVSFWFHHHFQVKIGSFQGSPPLKNSPISYLLKIQGWKMIHASLPFKITSLFEVSTMISFFRGNLSYPKLLNRLITTTTPTCVSAATMALYCPDGVTASSARPPW